MKILKAVYLLAFMAAALSSFTNCEKENDIVDIPEDIQIQILQDDVLGDYIADEAGLTLYYFSKDVDGTSVCAGACETNWPIYYRENLVAGAGLKQSGIGVITRADGSKQNTYKGWPLYYFVGDNQAGDTNGEAVGGNWFVAKADYDVMIGERQIDGQNEKYLVDDKGNTLYLFTADKPNESACSGGCLTAWPSFSTEVTVAPSTIDVQKFGVINGTDGNPQITFASQPLYYYNQDAARGAVNGQGAGNSWFVLTESDITN